MSAISAVALMVLALWVWGRSGDLAAALVSSAARPDAELWAVRSAAVAAAAGAQLLLLSSVMTSLFRRGLFDEALRFITGLVASVGIVGAFVLAVYGR